MDLFESGLASQAILIVAKLQKSFAWFGESETTAYLTAGTRMGVAKYSISCNQEIYFVTEHPCAQLVNFEGLIYNLKYVFQIKKDSTTNIRYNICRVL